MSRVFDVQGDMSLGGSVLPYLSPSLAAAVATGAVAATCTAAADLVAVVGTGVVDFLVHTRPLVIPIP
jgi:hypothetical protein